MVKSVIIGRESVVNSFSHDNELATTKKSLVCCKETPKKWSNGDKVVLSGDKLTLSGDNWGVSGDKASRSGDKLPSRWYLCEKRWYSLESRW